MSRQAEIRRRRVEFLLFWVECMLNSLAQHSVSFTFEVNYTGVHEASRPYLGLVWFDLD